MVSSGSGPRFPGVVTSSIGPWDLVGSCPIRCGPCERSGAVRRAGTDPIPVLLWGDEIAVVRCGPSALRFASLASLGVGVVEAWQVDSGRNTRGFRGIPSGRSCTTATHRVCPSGRPAIATSVVGCYHLPQHPRAQCEPGARLAVAWRAGSIRKGRENG